MTSSPPYNNNIIVYFLACLKAFTPYIHSLSFYHFFVRGETDSNPSVSVCTHLEFHICANASETQEVFTGLCVTAWFAISTARERQINGSTHFIHVRTFLSFQTCFNFFVEHKRWYFEKYLSYYFSIKLKPVWSCVLYGQKQLIPGFHGTTWGWVNYDIWRIFIFGWTVPLRSCWRGGEKEAFSYGWGGMARAGVLRSLKAKGPEI